MVIIKTPFLINIHKIYHIIFVLLVHFLLLSHSYLICPVILVIHIESTYFQYFLFFLLFLRFIWLIYLHAHEILFIFLILFPIAEILSLFNLCLITLSIMKYLRLIIIEEITLIVCILLSYWANFNDIILPLEVLVSSTDLLGFILPISIFEFKILLVQHLLYIQLFIEYFSFVCS